MDDFKISKETRQADYFITKTSNHSLSQFALKLSMSILLPLSLTNCGARGVRLMPRPNLITQKQMTHSADEEFFKLLKIKFKHNVLVQLKNKKGKTFEIIADGINEEKKIIYLWRYSKQFPKSFTFYKPLEPFFKLGDFYIIRISSRSTWRLSNEIDSFMRFIKANEK